MQILQADPDDVLAERVLYLLDHHGSNKYHANCPECACLAAIRLLAFGIFQSTTQQSKATT